MLSIVSPNVRGFKGQIDTQLWVKLSANKPLAGWFVKL